MSKQHQAGHRNAEKASAGKMGRGMGMAKMPMKMPAKMPMKMGKH